MPKIFETSQGARNWPFLILITKLVFNIKKIFSKVPGLRTKVGTYAAALFLLKDTFKESVSDPDLFEKEFIKYLKEENIEFDDEIQEEVIGFGEQLPKGRYRLKQDILNKQEEELSAKKGDIVIAFVISSLHFSTFAET